MEGGYEMNAKIWKTAFVMITVAVMAIMSSGPNASFAMENDEVKIYGCENNVGMFTDEIDFGFK
jgi:hypothetical protein